VIISYRRMNENDLAAAHALSQGLRWPYRLEDWQFLLSLGIGFVTEEGGAVIGTGLCWKQGDRHGSLGAIIVSPEATGAIHQHQGTMRAAPPVALAEGERIRPITADDIAKLVALANRATGMSRDEVLKQLACAAEGAALERDGELVGFSMMRRFGLGHAIGPVVAPDSERALALITCWSEAYAGSFVRLDVTGTSGLGDSVTAMGLVQVDTVVTMARNGVPAQDESIKQFALLNQSLF
jgi:hypothetical protein